MILRTLSRCAQTLTLSVIALPGLVLAHHGPDDHEHEHEARTPAVPDAVAHRPTALPDRILLSWTGDPARSQAVTWRTDTTVRRAVAQIAPADAGPRFSTRARTVPAVTTPLTTDLGEARHHTAQFEGLEPGTLYAYRVGDGTNWSEWIQFRTASTQAEPFAFLYFGDAQNDLKSLWSRVIRSAYADAPRARFILHAGDLINRAHRDAEWGEWFGAGGWVNAMVPSLPTPGNHEYGKLVDTEDAPRLLDVHWRPQFALPENGPPGLEETAYFLDFQGVRIVALNSNERHAEQAAWLDDVLQHNPCRWTILTFHHPLYSAAQNRDNAALRALWQPVIDRHRVDLVLQGHDHTYARSGLQPSGVASTNVPEGQRRRDLPGGTVYVVSVSGPKMYALDREPWMRRAAEDTQLYQIVHIDGDRLRYEARTAVGTLYDAFELRKRPGAVNELRELQPEVAAERLRPPSPVGAALGTLPVAFPPPVPQPARR